MKSCFDCKYNCTAESFENCTSKGLLFYRPLKKEKRVSEERSCETCKHFDQDYAIFCEDVVEECTDYNKSDPKAPRFQMAHAESETCESLVTSSVDKRVSDGSTASYYELPEGATELQDLISYLNLNAQIGEIIRACYRYGRVEHSEMLRDAKKIKFYAEAEIKRLEKLKEN